MSELHCPTCGRKLTVFQGEGTCLDCNKSFPAPSDPTKPSQPVAPPPSRAVALCAIGMIAAFFMPWFQLLGASVSGYQLTQFGSYGNYAWIIPVLAGLTVILGASGTDNRVMGVITGLVPLAATAYAYFAMQPPADARQRPGVLAIDVSGILQHTMAIGLFLILGLSVAIIFCCAQNRPSQK